MLDIYKHPAIDKYRTISNDVHEIYAILGIEAARYMLINEITEIFEQSSSYVNSRHIALLVDVMTHKGGLMSIDRHGINKSDRGPLAKCSFEETPDVLSRAAIFGELDNMKGVSSNIMLGQEVPIGTGSLDILFDEERYFDLINEQTIQFEEEELIETDNTAEKTAFINKLCSSNMFSDNTFDTL